MKNLNKKFTFKTKKATGRYRSFFHDYHIIKLKQKEVGSINDKYPHKIRLMVVKKDINEDGNANCKGKWITLKKESASLQDAKNFLNDMRDLILSKFELHYEKF